MAHPSKPLDISHAGRIYLSKWLFYANVLGDNFRGITVIAFGWEGIKKKRERKERRKKEKYSRTVVFALKLMTIQIHR